MFDPVDTAAIVSTSLQPVGPLGPDPSGGMAPAAAGLGDLYVIASSETSVQQLGQQLQARGVRTLTLAPGEGLAALVHHLGDVQHTGGWQRLHLLSHGSDGALQIGEQVLTTRNLWRQRESLRQLGELFEPGGDLLLYGCDLAASAAGKRLVDRLADLTGTDVAASDDDTGSALLGHGDWQLEYTHGTVDLGGADVLTGLAWDGRLGGSASLSNGSLNISSASGSLGISATGSSAAGTLSVTVTGLDSPWSEAVGSLSAIAITGDQYTINGIDLDTPGSAYTVALNGSVTITGEIGRAHV